MNKTPSTRTYRFPFLFLILILAVLFSIIAAKVANTTEYLHSDFFKFWLSGRLVSQGQNPYDSQTWSEGHHQFGSTWIPEAAFLYPFPLALFFVPFGLLPIHQAFIVWDVLLQFSLISSMTLLLRKNSISSVKHFVPPLLAGIILFRPTIVSLVNGQLSGVLLLLMTCILHLWKRGKWKQGTALMALLALKPNLGGPIIVLLSLYLIRQKRFSSLVVGALSGLFLVFAGWLRNPNWIVEFWNVGNSKLSQTFGFSPTIWGLTASFCSYSLNCILKYGTAMAMLFLIGYLYLLIWKRDLLSPAFVISLAIIITLLLTPYTWPYDQLLLAIPIITITMNLAGEGYKFIPVSLIFLATDVLAWILYGISINIQMEIWNAGIPLFVLGILTWHIFKKTEIPKIAREAL